MSNEVSEANPERPVRGLRWWPAAVLVALILALPRLPSLFEAPSLPLFMAAFIGPAALGVVILLWWLLASRATGRERAIGFVLYVALAAVALMFCDQSMLGPGMMVYIVPLSAVALAVPLILLAAWPAVRLPVALLSCAIMFGFWTLIRYEGANGRFESSLAWRWSATAEQKHLARLASKPAAASLSNSAAGPALVDEAGPPVTLASAEWSSFRGPLRDGKQPGLVIDTDWQSHPPKQLWSVTIGPGWSSFAVAGHRLFTQEQRGENEAVVCLHAETGEVLWSYDYPSRFWEAIAGTGPRATPTIADEGLFSLGAKGRLVCLDARQGQFKWSKDIAVDADREPPMWGFAASPLVTRGLVIVHAGGQDDKGLLAYDAQSGQLKWHVASGDHTYSSPQLATLCGVEGILMETNLGLQFLDFAGQQLWEHSWPLDNYRALQPHVAGDVIYLAGTLGAGVRKLSVSREEQQWNVKEDWTSTRLKPDFNDFVLHEGFLYGFDGNILACTNATDGQRAWKKGRYGNGQVLLLPDADQLLVLSEKGDLAVVATNSEEFTELAKIHAIDGKSWNHPVLIGGRAYVRNDSQAACYELPLRP